MTRKLNLRIWRGDSTDGGLKDVVVDVNEEKLSSMLFTVYKQHRWATWQFVGTVRLVSADLVQWRSTVSHVLHV